MQMLSANPASAYRRVALEARIEGADPAGLTRICLEEAIAAIGQALAALAREPGRAPCEPISRAQAIAVWLASSVDATHPLRASLVQFYGGQAAALGACAVSPDAAVLARVREDFLDLLNAA